MSAKDILESIISKPLDSEKGIFDLEKFIRFFRAKNNKLSYPKEQLYYTGDNFVNGRKLAEGKLDDGELIVCSFLVKDNLTERSGKKVQYQLGKKILKDDQKDAGIFIFYDARGDFRFSLIYTNYLGKRRDWSNFKRFTYFVSKDFTNKTFLNQVGNGDFTTLEKIKEAFSVEPVTKQFYAEIQTWYFWAMDKIKFPDDYKYSNDTAKNKEIRNATNLIRLITRIIFIWFLKEKDLIPAKLFLKDELKTIVKSFMEDNNSSNFYNAILQNLFFGTLNQKMNERKFADESGYPANKKEYGVKNLYRYADKFLINKNEVLNLFKDIPFLNGGLFDCLDKENETGKVIYIDGFSRNKVKQAIIPDYLFFQENEEKVDLSNYILGANKPVRGLIEILNSYNFIIDENTPIDQEIALDPELLGKVFENLLASYNPETATTKRKATGSYYTPREIVDYMVEASLFEYLKEKLPKTDNLSVEAMAQVEEKIKTLLSYSETIPEFSEEEKQKLISAIDEIKILDPACGSGAFPMGVLHKLVFALQKLDPENKYWHELQYQKALEETGEVFKQFKQEDKKQREERLKEINETFDEGINYPDYARKLYLIENCIYGVDIQPIAIQISKLRFFISLVLDQKVNKNKENFGIRALPNLETRFVAADTLIGLEIPQEYLLFQNTEVKQILDKLAEERHKYFNAKTRREKLDYQKQDKILREKLSEKVKDFLKDKKQDEINQIKKTINEEELKLQKVTQEPEDFEIIEQRNLFGEIKQIKINKKEERIKAIKRKIKEYEKNLESIQKQLEGDFVIQIAKKIASFDLYDQNAFADFFDSEWMFGVKDGFDIVIANPPYVRADNPEIKKQRDAVKKSNAYETLWEKWDLYVAFIERGYKILTSYGILEFIIPDAYMTSKYAIKSHRYFLENALINRINFCSELKIFEAAVRNIIIEYKKAKDENHIPLRIKHVNEWNDFILLPSKKQSEMGENAFKMDIENNSFGNLSNTLTWGEVCYVSVGLVLQAEEKLYKGEFIKEDLISEKKDKIHSKSYIEAKWVSKYIVEKIKYLEWDTKRVPNKTRRPTFPELYIPEKILMGGMTGAIYDDTGLLCNHSIAVSVLWKDLKDVQNRSIDGSIKKDFKIMNIYPFRNQLEENSKRFNLKYLLAILNSQFAYKFLDSIRRSQIGFYPNDLKKLPIKIVPKSEQQPFISLVDKILSTTKDDDYLDNPSKQAKVRELERQIDQMVYKLYGLTEEEIKIVEKHIYSKNHK